MARGAASQVSILPDLGLTGTYLGLSILFDRLTSESTTMVVVLSGHKELEMPLPIKALEAIQAAGAAAFNADATLQVAVKDYAAQASSS